jgi:hypothetical protein
MKLNEKYNPDDYIISENVFYTYNQEAFFECLQSPPNVDVSRERYEEDGFYYDFNDREVEYYRDQYLLLHDSISYASSSELSLFFTEEQAKALKIGRLELDLLLFLELADRNLVVLGDVGWGKTTRMRYVYYYLLKQSEYLRRKYLPFYFSLDQFKNQLQHAAKGEEKLRAVFRDEILKPKLRKATTHHTSIQNENFWSYLKRLDEFSHLAAIEIDLSSVHDSELELKKAVARERMQARSSEFFEFAAIGYIAKELKIKPVIVIDNSDPLDSDANTWILWEMAALAANYDVKTVVALRKNTFWRIFNRGDGLSRALHPIRSNIDRPNAKVYTESKLDLIKSRLNQKRITVVDDRGKKLSSSDIMSVYTSMIEIMLHAECQAFFANLAGGDLRRWARLLRVYFQTGYINDHDIMWRVIGQRYDGESDYDVPLWVAINSILTNNHKTYFSQEPRDAEQDVVINLLCNGRYGPNMYLIRLHILSAFARKKKINLGTLKGMYEELCSADQPSFEKSFNHAIRRLVNGGLVTADALYRLDNLEEVDKLEDLNITDCGQYYNGKLLHYFEYLSFMKDDIDYPSDIGIKDCIQEGQPAGRFVEILKYLRFLFGEESKFIRNLGMPQRRSYRENFAPARDTLYFSMQLTRSMIDFSKRRRGVLARYAIEFERLLAIIESDNLIFISDMDKPK